MCADNLGSRELNNDKGPIHNQLNLMGLYWQDAIHLLDQGILIGFRKAKGHVYVSRSDIESSTLLWEYIIPVDVLTITSMAVQFWGINHYGIR